MSVKFALIIGNTEYIDSGLAQLNAPGRDAEDFAHVLKDPEIGAFDKVDILLNQPEPVIREAIDEFFDQKKPDDLLVLYFSGHGIRDEIGALYLAVRNTNRYRLRSTAVKSDFIREAMDQSRSRRQVLILDCCNSGAFTQGMKTATGISIGTAPAFEGGYGRIILTASDSTQFAWEGDKVIGETDNSLFTHFLVQGLKGEADLDGDGSITVDELYDFAYEKVRLATPKQTPSKFSSKQQGEIFLRQNMRINDIRPVPLPPELLDEAEDLRPYVREIAVQKLGKILTGKNIGMAHSAAVILEKIATDENTTRRVAQIAEQTLESFKKANQKLENEQRVILNDDKEKVEETLASEKEDDNLKMKEEQSVQGTIEAEHPIQEQPAQVEAQENLSAQEKKEAARKKRRENTTASKKSEQEVVDKTIPPVVEKRNIEHKTSSATIEEAERKSRQQIPQRKIETHPAKKINQGLIITPFVAVVVFLFCLSAGYCLFAVYLPKQNSIASSTSTAIAAKTNIAAAESTSAAISKVTSTAIARATSTAIVKTTSTAIAKATNTAVAFATNESRENYISTISAAAQLIYGAQDGELTHNADDDNVETFEASIDVRDFIAIATFFNPFPTSTGTWDFGFTFRDQYGNDQYRLIVTSEKHWSLRNHTGSSSGSLINEGDLSNLDTTIDGSNTIWLYSQGDQGFLYLNGEFVSGLDLSARTNSGDISVGTGFFSDNEITGNSTRYEEFTVWEIP